MTTRTAHAACGDRRESPGLTRQRVFRPTGFLSLVVVLGTIGFAYYPAQEAVRNISGEHYSAEWTGTTRRVPIRHIKLAAATVPHDSVVPEEKKDPGNPCSLIKGRAREFCNSPDPKEKKLSDPCKDIHGSAVDFCKASNKYRKYWEQQHPGYKYCPKLIRDDELLGGCPDDEVPEGMTPQEWEKEKKKKENEEAAKFAPPNFGPEPDIKHLPTNLPHPADQAIDPEVSRPIIKLFSWGFWFLYLLAVGVVIWWGKDMAADYRKGDGGSRFREAVLLFSCCALIPLAPILVYAVL